MKRVIIVGSPRTRGRSAHLAEMIFEANIDERPEDELFLVPVSEIEVGPCIGCGGCRELTEVKFKDDAGAEYTEMRPRCVFDDDMQALYDVLDDADELTVVSPIYFSGAPAPMKCVLDRMQPYFWANTRKAPKRAAVLHVVGEGGDPHGFSALQSEVTSALAVAGFRLERVFNWVGKINESGEIIEEAEEQIVWSPSAQPAGNQASGFANRQGEPGNPHQVAKASGSGRLRGSNRFEPKHDITGDEGANRPKLNLSSGRNAKRAGTANKAASKPNGPGGKAANKAAGKNAGKPSGKRGKSRG